MLPAYTAIALNSRRDFVKPATLWDPPMPLRLTETALARDELFERGEGVAIGQIER